SVQSKTPIRKYVAKKDRVSILKADQFNIYSDKAKKDLRYCIESYYSPMQKSWTEAKIEILDTRNTSNEWLLGEIKENFAWFIDQYTITLAERTVLLQSKVGSRTFKFYNETKKLLASDNHRRAKVREGVARQ
ncbi:unnamed protein product, partial [Adineta steineri]